MADFSVEQLFQDKNFLSALAGMGTKFGRGGAGEAIGVPAQQMIQSEAAQKATAAQSDERKKFWENLARIMAGTTPKGTPGVSGGKFDAGGDLTLSITPPSATAGGAADTGATPTPAKGTGFNFSDIVPF